MGLRTGVNKSTDWDEIKALETNPIRRVWESSRVGTLNYYEILRRKQTARKPLGKKERLASEAGQ